MFNHSINPAILNIGPLEIRWYGVVYAIGFLIVYLFLADYARKGRIKNMKEDDAADFMIFQMIAVILGSRIFEILFYDLSFYLQNPLQMLMIWRGGLSFHGGLVFSILAAYWFCKKRKISFLQLGDVAIIPVALALFLGRIANFINGELYGIKTAVSLCVNFNGVDGCRHPTQIYEGLKNLAIFFTLFLLEKSGGKDRKHSNGTIFFMFLLMYGVMRFFIEFLKDLPIVFLGLKMGQIFCLFMVAASVVFFLKNKQA